MEGQWVASLTLVVTLSFEDRSQPVDRRFDWVFDRRKQSYSSNGNAGWGGGLCPVVAQEELLIVPSKVVLGCKRRKDSGPALEDLGTFSLERPKVIPLESIWTTIDRLGKALTGQFQHFSGQVISLSAKV